MMAVSCVHNLSLATKVISLMQLLSSNDYTKSTSNFSSYSLQLFRIMSKLLGTFEEGST